MATTEMNCLASGGGGGHVEAVASYTAGDKIECPFTFSKVVVASRRNGTAQWSSYPTSSDKQIYCAGSDKTTELSIGQSGWNGIISEVGSDYIKMSSNLTDVYCAFVV